MVEKDILHKLLDSYLVHLRAQIEESVEVQ